MYKKVMGLVLCLSLMSTSLMEAVSFGAAADRGGTENTTAGSSASADFLTISGMMRQFDLDDDWMDEQLSKGYTLYQIYKALLGGKEGYETAISQFEPAWKIDLVPVSGQTKEPMVQMDNLPAISAAAADYDQTAIEQLSLKDESSRYERGYAEDSVDAATGDVTLHTTDLTLSGALPFGLTRIYDSARASEEIGVAMENGAVVNQTSVRREEQDSALGRGWRWELPFIEEREGTRILDFPGIGRYSLSDDLKLQGYPWKDLLLTADATKTVGDLTSDTKVSVLNGNQYFFSSSGHLILIADNYGNQVELHYTGQNNATVLSRIKNSDGNELTFAYAAGQMTVTQTGTDRKMEYRTAVDDGQPVLKEVKDALGRSTQYFYSYPESRYNFLAALKDLEGQQPVKHSALLMRVIHPASGTTEFDYVPARKQIGEYATDFVFKAKERKNMYSTPLGDVVLQPAEFSYSGEDLNSFGQAAAWATTIKEARTTDTLKFRKAFQGSGQPDRLYLDEQRSDEATTGFERQFRYDEATGWNVPVQVTESYAQGGSESQPLTATYRYNEQGQVLSENWSTGQETIYEYTGSSAPYFWSLPNQVQTKLREGQKRIECYQYNDQGSVSQSSVRENSASGKLLAQTDWEYDIYGNPTVSKVKDDKRTNTVNYSYASPYGKHLLTKQSRVIHAVDGTSTESKQNFTYTAAGELLTAEDEAGAVTTYTYDALGRMIETLYSDQTKTAVQYDDDHNTVTTTGPEGIVTLEKYDPFGRLVKEVVDDAIFEYTYDEAGNMDQQIDAEQNITKFTYDGFSRPTQTLYADGSQDETSYDMVNRTVTYTDPAGVKQRQKLDLLGNTVAVEEWKDGTFTALQQTAYDLEGNAVSVTDGKGQQTLNQYDALGRIVTVTDPEQRVTKYTYSLAGNLVKIEYPDNTYVEKEYNEAGSLIRQINEEHLVEAFFYDSKGNLSKSLDHSSRFTEYQYNSDNLLTQITVPDQKIQYAYDAMGRRTGMTDATGSTTYSYDPADGSLTYIRYPDGTRIDYSYNKQMRTGYTLTDATGKAAGASYTLDKMNRVSTLGVVRNEAGIRKSALAAAPTALSEIDRITFDYKANGLLEQGASVNGPSTSYSYEGYDLTGMTVDAGAAATAKKAAVNAEENSATATEAVYGLAKLSVATGHTFKYDYDLNKNITSRTQNGAVDTFTYDPLNRIQTESGLKSKKYAYDERGNQLTVEGRELRGLTNAEFTFDGLNRLTKVKTEDGKEVSYIYNGDGLLYERVEGTNRTRYYYDEDAKLIAEANVNGGTPSVTYTYLYDLSGRLWSRVDQATGEVQYYQLNGHGDVVGLTDNQGNQLNTYTYDIWGNPETEEETVPNVFRYSGEYWDNTTDLQYLRARWYDPNAGRFVSKDPYEGSIDNPQSLNRYSYVANNPLIYTDPSGQYIMPMGPTPSLTCAVDMENCKTNLDAQIKGGQQAFDIVYLDDAKTLMSKDASGLEKGGTLIQMIPIFKAFKVVKKTEKTVDLSKDIIKDTKRIKPIKPINLPSYKSIKIDIDHIISGHTKGGARAKQSKLKDLFPDNMSKSQIEKAIQNAYSKSKKIQTQGDRVLVRGESNGITIEMWVNTKTKTIETAYPVSK
ncbi:RHS repeat-associated core domain-containing protein [Paenibacillus phocaensis]|uniref:RHS repeat-associated core domain-containing protein n=1 Tax=Paenibacillus phocaensis TaxID=1776378 RepID=UPI0018E26A6F|nr:RHS repeat-associated core domain-containing protein [Paenibacillus phocaensis]